MLPRSLPVLAASLAASAVFAFAGDVQLPALSGGNFTVTDESALAYSLPGPGLDVAQLELFANGRQEFHQRWVVLAVIGGKWGRGPTSNGEICIDCHAGNGRGQAPESASEPLVSMVVRLSIPGEDEHGGPLPHPNYGDQLQGQGELGRVFPEGDAVVAWSEHEERLADGSSATVRTPKLGFSNLAFGPLGADIMTSVRIAPAVFGAGLLDAVAESELLDIARRQQELGFNGRPNYVWDAEKQTTALGRFGWRANQPSLRQQDASAFLNDMGEGLADGRPDFRAGPRDWRTPPLWGIGLSRKVNGNASLLHDDRARDLTDAIRWRGGEAAESRV